MAAEAAALRAKGARAPGRATMPAFAKAAASSPGRIGFLYVSPIETARALMGAMGAMTPPSVGQALESAQETRGVLLEWGVDEARTRLEARLDLSAEALLPLKPALDAMSGPSTPMMAPPHRPGPGPGPFRLRPPGTP